jgi:8-hydroxy-5-deazaflavin:NADPH oxidoreductase
MKIGILGRGNVATALGHLAASAGHEVVLSSPHADTRLVPTSSGLNVGTLDEAANSAEVAIVALPFHVCEEVLPKLSGLTGKVVVDVTNPVNTDWSPMLLGENTSGAQQIAMAVPGSTVVKCFNTVFADVMRSQRLSEAGAQSRLTTFVAGDDTTAVDTVAGLAENLGFEAVRTGGLGTSRLLENLAHLNIQIAVGTGTGTGRAFVYETIELQSSAP